MHGRLSIGQLAQRERVTAPTMSNSVDVLADAGFVVRVPDENDRRRVNIDITDAGLEVVIATVHKRDSALAEALVECEFTDDELHVLQRASALMRTVAER